MGNDKFKYLPQLIVANDDNAIPNLIHITGAEIDSIYYCPCCGGEVRPRAINSDKEQAHYYHLNGSCSKESQLMFFCQSWLFNPGSKFYVDGTLYDVAEAEINKSWDTPFGEYTPDVTVTTTNNQILFFELFFNNRKTDSDYFCMWQHLKHPVVEVNLKQYMMKTSEDEIPSFDYLFNDGICFSKKYMEKDVYARTIGRRVTFLDKQLTTECKIRIEKLDDFWSVVKNRNNNPDGFRDSIIDSLKNMSYEDKLVCLDIVKSKQCLKFLKKDVINMLYEDSVNDFLKSLDLSYADVPEIKITWKMAKTTIRIGWSLTYKEQFCNFHFESIDNPLCECKPTKEGILEWAPNVANINNNTFAIGFYDEYVDVKLKYESIKNLYSQLLTLDSSYKFYITDKLYVMYKNIEIYNAKLDSCCDCMEEIETIAQNMDNVDFYIDKARQLSEEYGCEITVEDSSYYFLGKAYGFHNKDLIKDINTYKNDVDLIDTVNFCNNRFWKITQIDKGRLYMLDQNIFTSKRRNTCSYIFSPLTKEKILKSMYDVLQNMEKCGYRVMEE